MNAYGAVMNARFRLLLQYRAAAAAGFVTQLFWGLIRVMIFEAFYRSTRQAQPLHFDEMVTYIWLGQAFFALLPWTVDLEVREMVRTGGVAYELVRPVDLYGLWLSRAVAGRAAPTLLRGAPMLLVAGLWLGLKPPPTIESGVAWAATLAMALLLSSAISALMTVTLVWTISGEGVSRIVPAIVYTFSGMLIPLPLLPDWARAVSDFLPFRGLIDAPFRVYLGHIPPSEAGAALAHQLLWTSGIVLFGRWLLRRAARRLVVQGG